MIFLYMQIFQVGALKGNFLVLFAIRIITYINYKMDENGVTWVIIDFCQLIMDFDVIKDLLMEMRSIEKHPKISTLFWTFLDIFVNWD